MNGIILGQQLRNKCLVRLHICRYSNPLAWICYYRMTCCKVATKIGLSFFHLPFLCLFDQNPFLFISENGIFWNKKVKHKWDKWMKMPFANLIFSPGQSAPPLHPFLHGPWLLPPALPPNWAPYWSKIHSAPSPGPPSPHPIGFCIQALSPNFFEATKVRSEGEGICVRRTALMESCSPLAGLVCRWP